MILFSFSTLAISDSVRGQEIMEKFEQISIHQGLSQDFITSIMQDKDGMMWFGTLSGLNKFDGMEVTVYTNDAHDPNSLTLNWITSLCEDQKGRFWVGTNGAGINMFTKSNAYFKPIVTDATNPYSLGSLNVSLLLEDMDGNVWIGTADAGIDLQRYREDSLKFEHFRNQPGDRTSLSNDDIRVMHQRKDGSIWIGTQNGLNKLVHSASGKITFERFYHDPTNPNSISGNEITSIFEDTSGRLWIGTANNGLNLMLEDGRALSFEHFMHEESSPSGLTSNAITSIQEDDLGQIWVGTRDQGIDILTYWGKDVHIRNLRNDPLAHTSISNNIIKVIYKSRSGMMWIGSWGGGIDKLNSGKTDFEIFRHDPSNVNSLMRTSGIRSFAKTSDGIIWIGSHNGLTRFDKQTNEFSNFGALTDDQDEAYNITIYAILPEKNSTLWLGTSSGLVKYDRDKNKFINYRHDANDPKSIGHNIIRSLKMDKDGNIWMATYAGLEKYNPITDEFTHHRHDPNDPTTPPDDGLYTLTFDHKGQLWVGWNFGLFHYDLKKGTDAIYVHDSLDSQSLGEGLVLSIYEDAHRTIWVGTYGGGLNKLDKKTGKFIRYTTENGLQNDVIYGILQDKVDNLWMSTNIGISKLNLYSLEVHNYDVRDGLQSNEFNGGAYFQAKDGEMFFGGVGGYNSFYPAQVKDNTYVPPIILTAFKVFGKHVELEEVVSDIEEIVISYKDNFFSFEFVALDYLDPKKNQYAYILENFDQDWIYSGTRRFASYTNLKPGTYIFRVRGSNSDGVWNLEGARVTVIIIPPFWYTGWFKLIMVIVGLLLIYTFYKVIVTQLYNKRLKKEVDYQTSELNTLNSELQVLNTDLAANNAELEKLSIVARETGNGVFITDADGNVEWFNEGFSKVFGWTSLEEYIKDRGRNILEVTGHSNIQEIIDESVREKKSITYEGYNPTKDGRYLWVQATLTPIFDENGTLKRLVFVDTDISELKKAKETAEQALEIQEEFLANTSHEIRTPMNGVIGMTRQLLGTPLNKEQKEYMNAIKESSGNLLHVVNDLLDISKIRAGKMVFEKTEFRLTEIFKNLKYALQYRAKEKKIFFKTVLSDEIPPVLIGDPMRLNQVLLNLVVNAIKFTSSGGVTISAKVVSHMGTYSLIEFTVEDTGIGIEEDQLDYVFESFAQAETHTSRKYGGTGLGLSISKSLIEEQNGTIGVQSKINEGSTFYFALSFEIGNPNWIGQMMQPSEGIPANVDMSDIKILLVDDNKINQRVALYELNRWKTKTDVADSAKKAFELLNTKSYDLILMDIAMPEIDGIQATEYIRKELGEKEKVVPIIAMTASVLEGEKGRCIQAGMNDYISKPFDPINLYYKLIKWGRMEDVPEPVVIKRISKSKKSEGIVDLSLLRSRAGDDIDYIKEMIEIYLESLPDYLEEFNAAFERKQWGVLSKLAHKMRSAVVYFSTDELHDLLMEIEISSFGTKYLKKLSKSVEVVNDLCNKTMEELKGELTNLS